MEIKSESEEYVGQKTEPQGSSEGTANAPYPAPAPHPAPPHKESALQGAPEVGLRPTSSDLGVLTGPSVEQTERKVPSEDGLTGIGSPQDGMMPSPHSTQPNLAEGIPPALQQGSAGPKMGQPIDVNERALSQAELAQRLGVPVEAVSYDPERAQRIYRVANANLAHGGEVSDPTVLHYGNLAEKYRLDRSVGLYAGVAVRSALDAVDAFRNDPEQSDAAFQLAYNAVERAKLENGPAGQVLSTMLLDYKQVNPSWVPELAPPAGGSTNQPISARDKIRERQAARDAELNALGSHFPDRYYGDWAEELGMKRSVGMEAGPATRYALELLIAYRDAPDQEKFDHQALSEALQRASEENGGVGSRLRGMYFNYRSAPDSVLELMPERELVEQERMDTMSRFANSLTLAGAGEMALSSFLEAGGHLGPSLASKGIYRGATLPFSIYAGIDEAYRQGMLDEQTRRMSLPPDNIPEQLNLKEMSEYPEANEAMKSMIDIRDSGDRETAIESARQSLDRLKLVNPDAASILRRKLDAYIDNAVSVPELMGPNDLGMALKKGSSAANFLTMASATLDSITLGAKAAGRVYPALEFVAALAAIGSTGFAAADYASDNLKYRREQQFVRRRLVQRYNQQRFSIGSDMELFQ